MIKVKDPKRLKAFGFKDIFKDGNYVNPVDDDSYLIVYAKSPKVCFSGNSNKLLDVFFDLQAAGLLERVEDNG